MRICQVLAGNEDGGLEKHTIELSKRLVNHGLDVTVIAHGDFAQDFEGVTFIPLDLSRSRNNPWILYRLYRELKKGSFDIIHAQANKAASMVTRLKPFLPAKIVATLHNYKRDLGAFEKCDYVITVSDKIGEKLRTKTKKTVYNGIDFREDFPDRDLRADYDIPQGRFVICSVARFTKVKRFELLIEALKMLEDVHLILVGGGEEEEKLKKMVSDYGLQSRMTFTGSLNNRDVKSIVKNSDLFVMSSDREGFPYTFVETMFCETPFVSTPVSDIEKFIGAKYMAPFNDAGALAERIDMVRNGYGDVRNDFAPVFERAKREFTVENMVEQTMSVYREVLR